MPFAVTHILVPMILVDFARDHFFKIKKQFLPNKYVLLVGLFGLIPDIDMLSVLFGMPNLHGTITHSIIFPTIFFIGFLIFHFLNKERTYKIFLMLFIGFSIHIVLDGTFSDKIALFFPFDFNQYGLNLIGPLENWYDIYAAIDAILLFLWLIHEGLEQKISEYF
jgi:membrane-bound metal-dependent hydrolase YbcI (DUF457 family)